MTDESNFKRSNWPAVRRSAGEIADPSERDAGQRRCCFSDALDARAAGCAKAVKATRRYRRAVYCSNTQAHGTCMNWLDQMRNAARFSLGTRQSPSALRRRTAVKLQCGGLLGMGDLVERQPVKRIQDVSDLLRRALVRYGSFERVPLQAVVKRIHEFDIDDD